MDHRGDGYSALRSDDDLFSQLFDFFLGETLGRDQLTLRFAHASPITVYALVTNPENGGSSYFLN